MLSTDRDSESEDQLDISAMHVEEAIQLNATGEENGYDADTRAINHL